jgi:membrane protease YdiL (CAAX protease family)
MADLTALRLPASYWQASRAPRYSLLFALPLLVFYQVLAALQPTGPTGQLRNGADVILERLFIWLAGWRGPLVFLLALTGLGLWLIARDLRRHPGLRPALFAGMLGESVLLALLFGGVVARVTAALLGGAPPLLLGQVAGLGWWSRLMLSLGAGLYEELLFRVVLVALLAWGAQALLGWRARSAGVFATLLGAAIFSAFHYVGPYGDRLTVYSFMFRMVAGIFFSALYLLRGFGITAWTHALYDTFLLVV